MADTFNILHDLIDDQEMLTLNAHEHLLDVYRAIDPSRLTDPADEDFDAQLRDAVWDIMREAMSLAHQGGAASAERISGKTAGDRGGALLLRAAQPVRLRLNWLIEDVGRAIDRHVQLSRMLGQSDQTIVEGIVRTLESSGKKEGVSPAGGLRGLSHALAEVRRLFPQAITAAAQAGQREVFGA